MSEFRPSLRGVTLLACAAAAAAIVGAGGCSHNSASPAPPPASPTPMPSGSPTPTPSPTPTANVYVSMAYASMSPTIDPTYGELDGYSNIAPPPSPPSSPSPNPSPSPTQTPGPSSVVNVPCNNNIAFLNFDATAFHTASVVHLEGGGNGFPRFFNNPNGGTASVTLTPLSDPAFSTGYVGPDRGGVPGRSNVYTTGAVDATYYVGDFVNYNSTPSMRTVIVVTGCP